MDMNSFFNDLQGKINQAIDSSPAKDIEKNVKAMMTQGFSKLDLVTREEFDIQNQVLAKTRAKLEALELRVAQLEESLAHRRSRGNDWIARCVDDGNNRRDVDRSPSQRERVAEAVGREPPRALRLRDEHHPVERGSREVGDPPFPVRVHLVTDARDGCVDVVGEVLVQPDDARVRQGQGRIGSDDRRIVPANSRTQHDTHTHTHTGMGVTHARAE